MEWLQILIKWINCLNVLDTPIKTINELQNTQLYEKLIKLSWKKDISLSDNKDIITAFIEDEYPEFQIDKDKDQGYSEDVYIISLLLSHISLNSVFHRPMCTKLPHEVQVKIKSFLEMVLPYGKSITKQILKDAIVDLTDSEKENLFKTPRKPSLKEFFSSPVARSAQSHRMLNERNRQLRQLRSELETERFEKADLQEDLKIEQNKVRSLLKQLEEKSAEITTLKEEKIKFTSPQFCRKTKNALHNEDYYKKEIYRLENQLMQCHDEITKLEDQKTSIKKKLMFTEKRNISLNEKCNNLEISIETLTAEIEAKETELINLKINYEDLRAHIKKLNGTSIEDDSFESEDTGHGHSFLSPLNTSETLSSVIDIQLQEIKAENSLLKIQITQLKDKLDITSKQHDNSTQLIFSLQNQLKMLDSMKQKLSKAEEEILSLQANNKILENDKNLLQNQCKSLEKSILHNDKLVLQAEQSRKELSLELSALQEQIENLDKALIAEIAKCSDLEKMTQDQKKVIDDHITVDNENTVLKQQIHDLEVLQVKHKTEWDLESKSLHEKIENLDKALIAEIAKSSDLEKVIQDQKKVIDDHITVDNENAVLKQQIHDLEVLQVKHKTEWDLESKSLHEKIENLDKALIAEIAKSSDLEKVIQDQKKVIDDHITVDNENAVLKQQIHDLEVLQVKHKTEWDLKSKSLHEKIENLDKALIAEIAKSSDLEKVIKDQKKVIDGHIKVDNENVVLKQQIHDLEVLNKKYREEWDLESKTLHEKVENLDKALHAEIAKSFDLKKVESENKVLKHKIHDLEVLDKKHREEWDLKSKSLHEQIENLDKALHAEIAKSFDLKKVESENKVLKHKIHDLEVLDKKHREEWDLKSKSLHEQIENLDKALNVEISKSSDLKKVESENVALKQKIHDLEVSEVKCKAEWDLESKSLHEKIENLNKALNAEIAKSSDLEKVIQDQNNHLSEHIQQEENSKQKLQLQIDQLMKEKKEIKNKVDIIRVRNAKLERTLEEVRAEKKKVQEKLDASSQLTDLDNLKKEVAELKDSKLSLQEEIDKRNKESKENVKKEMSEAQLKEIHNKYEIKLEEMKQQMKVAYNEQVVKLNREQEKAIQEKVEQFQLKLEEQYQKHKEEIAKYKTHLNELNSQFWNVGEKLLTAQQEKQEILLQLNELKIKLQNEIDKKSSRLSIHHKTITSEKQENPFENSMQENSQIFSKMLTEENAYEKQHSAKNMHAIVHAFNAEDEEGEVFNNTYLADMKRGHCFPAVDFDRLSILRKRNSLCKPHLKSSYPAETQFQPLYFSEEEIKTGSVSEDMFNDSLSQILLPEQKTKKRDRTQTSYKKPGPPTPSKNGGRLSLHGSEIKSPNSKILKERNADRRATATPRRSKGIFNSKRQDENVAGTPRARRLSNMFRKARTTSS